MKMKYFCTLTLIVFISLAGCNQNVKEEQVTSSDVVREVDKIRLTDLNGKPLSLKQYAGKTIFINFWATWCKPCIQEMPSIKGAQDSLQNQDIVFFLASDESLEQIKEFRTSHDYKFNYVKIENSEELNVQTLPTTFIFNSKGEKVFTESGAREWNEKKNIDTILKIINRNE